MMANKRAGAFSMCEFGSCHVVVEKYWTCLVSMCPPEVWPMPGREFSCRVQSKTGRLHLLDLMAR